MLGIYSNSVIGRCDTNVEFSLDRVKIILVAGADVICFGVLVVDGYLFFIKLFGTIIGGGWMEQRW